MPKASPEKLAKALRANLKKRKIGAGADGPTPPQNPENGTESGPEKAVPGPSRRPGG